MQKCLSGELKKDFSIIGLETDLWNNTHKKEEEKDKKKWESVDVQPDFLFHANMVEKKEQIMIMEVKTCKVLDEKPFDWDLGKLCMYVYK